MKHIFVLLIMSLFALTLSAEECQKGFIDCQGHCGRFIDQNQDTYCDLSPLSPELRAELFPEEQKSTNSSPYWLFEILAGVGVLYLISLLLVKFHVWSKVSHRKLWNLLLAITFFMSGLIGLLLVVFINYNISVGSYRTWLILHVDFGIAMALISILHFAWHWNYYGSMFKRKSHS